MGPVTLIDTLSLRPGPWGTFSSTLEAMRFKANHQLGGEWTIFDRRPDGERDLLDEACSRVIDLLRPYWRARQFDRLARGEIPHMPPCDSADLSRDTTIALAQIFLLSDVPGWQPMTGGVMLRNGSGKLHDWLQHESGRIIDLCDPDAGPLGYSNNSPGEDATARYVAGGDIALDDDLSDPQGWANRVTQEVIFDVASLMQNVTSESEVTCEI